MRRADSSTPPRPAKRRQTRPAAAAEPEVPSAVAGAPQDLMAAVDIGSNSFHMVVARVQHGQLAIVDRLREMVRLASGLDRRGYLDAESQDRALATLRTFGQRLRDMDASRVRVVGTSTLRRARNAEAFLEAAAEALGHPVEVISGMEEARLIYLGVSRNVRDQAGANLVVDVGGGSTELIIGEGFDPKYLESLSIGCVVLTQRHFEDGRLTAKRFEQARMAARLEIYPVAAGFRRRGWARVVGSSGTVRAAGEVAHELGLAERGVTVDALEAIVKLMIKAKRLDDLKLPSLGADRLPVFAGGVAALVEVMRGLGIDRMEISDGALREGVLYDMFGRLQDEDARERTIRAMQKRYQVDEEQAERVESTVLALLEKVASSWRLGDPRWALLSRWASRLHEVGLDIAHSKYHRHGAYLLQHADLPGFVRLEQHQLSALVGFHRRKLDEASFEKLVGGWDSPLLKLIVLFRLAVLLNRTRSPVELPPLELRPGRSRLTVRFPEAWLEDNPLTVADLAREQEWLRARGFELRVETRKASRA